MSVYEYWGPVQSVQEEEEPDRAPAVSQFSSNRTSLGPTGLTAGEKESEHNIVSNSQPTTTVYPDCELSIDL